MTETAIARLIEIPVFGVIVVVLGFVCYHLYRRVDEVQKQRVEDAQSVASQLIRVNEQFITTISSVTSALEANREAMSEVKQAIRDFGEDLRRPRR